MRIIIVIIYLMFAQMCLTQSLRDTKELIMVNDKVSFKDLNTQLLSKTIIYVDKQENLQIHITEEQNSDELFVEIDDDRMFYIQTEDQGKSHLYVIDQDILKRVYLNVDGIVRSFEKNNKAEQNISVFFKNVIDIKKDEEKWVIIFAQQNDLSDFLYEDSFKECTVSQINEFKGSYDIHKQKIVIDSEKLNSVRLDITSVDSLIINQKSDIEHFEISGKIKYLEINGDGVHKFNAFHIWGDIETLKLKNTDIFDCNLYWLDKTEFIFENNRADYVSLVGLAIKKFDSNKFGNIVNLIVSVHGTKEIVNLNYSQVRSVEKLSISNLNLILDDTNIIDNLAVARDINFIGESVTFTSKNSNNYTRTNLSRCRIDKNVIIDSFSYGTYEINDCIIDDLDVFISKDNNKIDLKITNSYLNDLDIEFENRSDDYNGVIDLSGNLLDDTFVKDFEDKPFSGILKLEDNLITPNTNDILLIGIIGQQRTRWPVIFTDGILRPVGNFSNIQYSIEWVRSGELSQKELEIKPEEDGIYQAKLSFISSNISYYTESFVFKKSTSVIETQANQGISLDNNILYFDEVKVNSIMLLNDKFDMVNEFTNLIDPSFDLNMYLQNGKNYILLDTELGKEVFKIIK